MAGLADYNEDNLVEKPAIEVFESLGWEHVNCYAEEKMRSPDLSGRKELSDVISVGRLYPALERLNPDLPPAALDAAIAKLTEERRALTMVRANQEVYKLLKQGAQVEYFDEYGEPVMTRVFFIDWTDPYNNDYFLASQLWVVGELHTRRPDLVGFVNGIPLVLVELKATSVKLRHAYQDNLSDYRDVIPKLFHSNALVLLSNGMRARVGTSTTPWEHFGEWKRISDEDEPASIAMETAIRGTCEPTRLLDLVENFTLFKEETGGLVKILAKNHQYLGVNNALRAVEAIGDNKGKLGVYWHTQGAGKTFSMLFFGQKVLRTIPGNWTFVIVTDRTELDDQAYKNFADAGAVEEPEEHVHASSAAHLRELLSEEHRYVFTLIHKFRTERGQKHPIISERDDIIVMTDEAHRTQYDILAQNMRDALPNAAFIGFTGTPLISGEEKTREIFGDYVSVYDFGQSIRDGATVPLWYENRIPELELVNEALNDDIGEALDEAMIDDDQEALLERAFSREYTLLTRDNRLDTIAEDIVDHFMSRGYLGKAMVVCVDKATAVRMYDKVQHHWGEYIDALREQLPAETNPQMQAVLREKMTFMQETDMAVVVSQGQNEVRDFEARGLDIKPHRARMVNETLDEDFKNAKNPLRIVFVCAMWMTGFDVKSCSTIYLDKPMKNHTLMQTIARANRVWQDKPNGLIVDYIGVFRNLQKALAIYGAGRGEAAAPIRDKDALFAELEAAIEDMTAFLTELGIAVDALVAADKTEFISLQRDAVENVILMSDATTQEYLTQVRQINALFKGILPHPRASEYTQLRAIFTILERKIRADTASPSLDAEFQREMETLLDESVIATGYVIPESRSDTLLDLSKIDFEALRGEFQQGKERIAIQRLRHQLAEKVEDLIRKNRTRANYREQLQDLIDEYNAGRSGEDVIYERLLQFMDDLSQEEQRTISENLTEEELAIFDILTRPGPALSSEKRQQIKQVARELLHALKQERLVIDWRKRQQSRSHVRSTIETALDKGLPQDSYDADTYELKCNEVYRHVFESYYGDDSSLYDVA